jgi:ADP-ribose pyrophosphatase
MTTAPLSGTSDRVSQFPRRHGPWTITSSAVVYADPWIRVRLDQVVRPDGRPGTHTVTAIKPGVCVIAEDDDGCVFLTSEFHYAVGRVTLEGVSGGCDGDESPEVAARRELAEELGLIADELIPLGLCDPFTAMVVSPTHLYAARGLTRGAASPEGTERIESVRLPFEQALDKVLASEITHGPTCVALLKWAHLRQV